MANKMPKITCPVVNILVVVCTKILKQLLNPKKKNVKDFFINYGKKT